MKPQLNRLLDRGRVDRGSKLRFTFDGRVFEGHQGDTLASALLANGVRVVGRSFKYHRPRGLYSAGPEEPNALVTLGDEGRQEPNLPATMIPLVAGLAARSQNAWPSLGLDFLAINGWLKPVLPAGFYYKTFKWPRTAWLRLYEPLIRRAAGLGALGREPDAHGYERAHVHCDVLVVGGGPAGILAAFAAGRAGARVVLAEERAALGGHLPADNVEIDDQPGADWAARTALELAVLDEVRILRNTTVFGRYDGLTFGAVERLGGITAATDDGPRGRSWTIHARHVVIATGAIEQPMVFAGNDLPGVMLAGAARRYLNHYGVLAGRRVTVATNNDDAYRTVCDLADAGAEVTLVDSRPHDAAPGNALLRHRGIRAYHEHGVIAATGGRRVKRVSVAPVAGGARTWSVEVFPSDLVCVSGGWSPTIHLLSHLGARPQYDPMIAAHLCREPGPDVHVVGGAAGTFDLQDLVEESVKAGRAAASAAGHGGEETLAPPWTDDPAPYTVQPYWRHPNKRAQMRTAFVDLQNDVTVADLELAEREGFGRPEHAKRYTTLGMATDQGKLANVNALGLLAGLNEDGIGDIGTTTYRPPYTPVALGSLAGFATGSAFRPTRRTPIHRWHKRLGAVFTDAGLWRRPYYYRRQGVDFAAAVTREVEAVRELVGVVDVSTFGKIELQGPDAGALLDRLYANPIASLEPGRARYGVMLREDGIMFDDGTVARLAKDHYVVTTSTAHAALVNEHMDHAAQVLWPELDVALANVTEQWAQVAVSGPKARHVVAEVVQGIDLDHADFPPLSVGEGTFAEAPARVFRISFSGELAYEVAVPAGQGDALWEAIMEAGVPHGILPYGTEAMTVLRTEKGHVAGAEIDGRTTARDLGLGRFMSDKKDYVGRWMADRAALRDPARPQLVGLTAVDANARIRAGSHLLLDAAATGPGASQGHVTTAVYSPTLGYHIALGLLKDGTDRHFDRIYAVFPLANESVEVKVRDPFFLDPRGARANV